MLVPSVDGHSEAGSLSGSYMLSSLPQPLVQEVTTSAQQDAPPPHVLPAEIPGIIHGMSRFWEFLLCRGLTYGHRWYRYLGVRVDP